jgi:hypothetical protein
MSVAAMDRCPSPTLARYLCEELLIYTVLRITEVRVAIKRNEAKVRRDACELLVKAVAKGPLQLEAADAKRNQYMRPLILLRGSWVCDAQ